MVVIMKDLFLWLYFWDSDDEMGRFLLKILQLTRPKGKSCRHNELWNNTKMNNCLEIRGKNGVFIKLKNQVT